MSLVDDENQEDEPISNQANGLSQNKDSSFFLIFVAKTTFDQNKRVFESLVLNPNPKRSFQLYKKVFVNQSRLTILIW